MASLCFMVYVSFCHKIMFTLDILQILRKSMKGVGTDDSRLIRVIVTRTEIDMHYIKITYYKKYGKPLTHAVKSDTSGHYKDLLLNLLGSDY